MPKRTDLRTILLIGSGPIVIGQACEFDYSGTQAVKALREEGYRVVLVNSNPATIMTDPDFADRTYIEPVTAEFVERVIAAERPDAVLPTMGGQTALNVVLELDAAGVFAKYGVELIGAKVDSITTAEDRELFRSAMDEIGLGSAASGIARSVKEAEALAAELGYPLVLRPSRTLGGSGGGIVRSPSDLARMVSRALSMSPNREVLIEQSLLGWKEIELEVMRDLKDNVVIVCSIENLDPMGVHTGDSITVAPVQTLTDKEYQILRDAAVRVIRRIGVDTGGSNVQFAVNPVDGRVVVIEMNPRVSRSSALASKATGFPIAKIAAKLAVGYTLDELRNDITEVTPACFEPSIDYVVVKIPRFNFEKFPLADTTLGTQMKSVGEVLSFGRTFGEALQKAVCSTELGTYGFDGASLVGDLGRRELLDLSAVPAARRLWYVAEALRAGNSEEALHEATGIDPWFLAEMGALVRREESLAEEARGGLAPAGLGKKRLLELKREGFSDARLAALFGRAEDEVSAVRRAAGVVPSFKAVDTCAGEFPASTPYLYSTYDGGDEMPPTDRRKIVILGSGPNRIGQGIEFDYCCVHAALALSDDGFETVMINCNPETVSTDYDISDRLYFEPLTFEHVRAVLEREKPDGVIVQFGGQTPLKLAARIEDAGFKVIGTPPASIDAAEDRERFSALVDELGLRQPSSGTARTTEEALLTAARLDYPLMVRPSFVLGGRAMRVVTSDSELIAYFRESADVSEDRPVLMDRYLDDAVEVDVDAVSDGTDVVIAGVMEHIERAGVHSGDSSCSLPPQTLPPSTIAALEAQAEALARRLGVIGLLNVQFAVTADQTIYVLEANPRASRTVPFVSKATGTPWAKVASRVMAGATLRGLGVVAPPPLPYRCVKASVFPFSKFQGVDVILGPEMKSTGEVMGIDASFAGAFAKSQYAAGVTLPTGGSAVLSVMDRDKRGVADLGRRLGRLGFRLVATGGTAAALAEAGVEVTRVNKVREGSPHVVDLIGEGDVTLVVNTPEGGGTVLDSRSIRLAAGEMRIPTYTTLAAAAAAVEAMEGIAGGEGLPVKALQDYHARPG